MAKGIKEIKKPIVALLHLAAFPSDPNYVRGTSLKLRGSG